MLPLFTSRNQDETVFTGKKGGKSTIRPIHFSFDPNIAKNS